MDTVLCNLWNSFSLLTGRRTADCDQSILRQAPLIIISEVFIPIESLPSMGQVATYFSPLTYGNDLIQAAYHGHTHFNPLLNIAMLCIIILLFQVFANQLYRRWNE